jgi:hypothetical protein
MQGLPRNGPEAASARSELYALLQELAVLKAERDRRNARSNAKTPKALQIPIRLNAASFAVSSTKPAEGPNALLTLMGRWS